MKQANMPMWITWNSEVGVLLLLLPCLPLCQPPSPPYDTLAHGHAEEPTLTQLTVHFIERVVLSALKIHMNKCTIKICLHYCVPFGL